MEMTNDQTRDLSFASPNIHYVILDLGIADKEFANMTSAVPYRCIAFGMRYLLVKMNEAQSEDACRDIKATRATVIYH